MTAWNPSKPIVADLLDFKLAPRLFIEQDETTVDDRAGWATPRKRPRRVHKKLAARCFVAKCRHGQPFPGSGVTKCRSWHGRAPKLAVWLRGSNPPGVEWAHQSITVRFEPVMFDGNTLAKPPYQDAVLSTGRVWVDTHTERAVFAHIEHGPVGPIERQIAEWRGQAMAFEIYAQARRVAATIVVFTPPGIYANDFAVTDRMERVVERIAYLMISAVQGLHETTVIARQTSYRPTPRILGSPE